MLNLCRRSVLVAAGCSVFVCTLHALRQVHNSFALAAFELYFKMTELLRVTNIFKAFLLACLCSA